MSVLLFPGQGSQSVGMGSEFYNGFSLVKKIFAEAEQEKQEKIRNSNSGLGYFSRGTGFNKNE